MAKRKKKSSLEKKFEQIIRKSFLKFLLKSKDTNLVNIRKVYFGLRIRFLGMLCLVTIVIISILTILMYVNQQNLLEEEKIGQAEILTKIMSGPTELYLDNNIDTSEEEYKLKYEIIRREANNFKKYNSDIVKIFLTDENGRIKYSTNRKDINKKSGLKAIQKVLKQNDNKLLTELDKENRYLSVTSPIYLNKGEVVKILNDYNKHYTEYHNLAQYKSKTVKRKRRKIYLTLWRKYKNVLGEEFDPSIHKQPKVTDEEISKAWDIEFVFVTLFSDAMKFRKRKISNSKMWLLKDKWLINAKKKKLQSYLNDMPTKAKEINDSIIKNMDILAGEIESLRKLGALAVIFDEEKQKAELDKNISEVRDIAFIMIAVSIIAFLFVLNFMIKNLKKLEKWAIAVSKGHLDKKIHIDTADEIGRLGDIFNYMIDELTVKYHLEKYVSRSTRSMIKQKKKGGTLALGGTARRNMVFIFSDVRGFTSFSEKNDPEIVIEVLNFYLELQSKIIKSNYGDIADYVGDEVMAQFAGEKRVDNAITTAVKIMKEIKKVNAERLKKDLPIFEVGIGIHGGDVVVGNIGSSFRMDFACVGDTVNLSARLCSAAGPREILVSKEIAVKAKKKHSFEDTASIAVKGKAKKIPIVKIKV